MPLTPFPITPLPGQYATVGVAFIWTAGDAGNHNSFTSSGREILMVQNTDTASHAHTIKSVPDSPENRTGDITETIGPLAFRTYQMFPSGGWALNGAIEVDPSNAALTYVVLRVP